MAKFFKKIKKQEEINIETAESRLPDSPAEDSNDSNEEYSGITRQKAKEDLEKRIEEKLSNITIDDLPFLQIQEERERQREALRAESERRKKRKTGKSDEDFFSTPIITEDAIIAVFKEDIKTEGEDELPEEKLPAPSVPVPLDNQIAMKDIPDIAKSMSSNGKEKAPPSEKEISYEDPSESPVEKEDRDIPEPTPEKDGKSVFQEFEYITDKIYYVILFPFKKAYVQIKRLVIFLRKQYFKRNPEARRRFVTRRRKIINKIRDTKDRFIEKDKEIAARMIHAVNRVDHRNDALAERAVDAASAGNERFNLAKEWAELNKKRLLLHFAGFIMCILGAVMIFNFVTAYEYSYNGRTLGLVKNQEDVLKIVDMVSEELTKEHNAEILIDKEEDIAFKRVLSIGKTIDDMEEVLNRMTYMQDMVAKGYGIYIDGKRTAIVDSETTADIVLNSVLASFMVESDSTVYEEVGFAEVVTVEPVDTRLGRLENISDVVRKILTGAEEIKTHIVESGETFSGIAQKYNIGAETLQAANPFVTPERLSIGQEIILTQSVPMLTVQTVEISTAIEYIEYATTYEDNASIYQGETSTKVRGQRGEREVTAKIVRNNGQEVARMELNSKMLKEPVTAVIYMGTKELPPKQGTGTFIYPVSGAKLTSKFGTRWGRMHYGIDLAIATGTKIRASDGGTVTFAGYSGSYGYVVKINHGGGFETVYAHCSKMHVKVGDKVYQGQHIANVGSTGRSTGPHCHFEIQYLGVQKNPLNYL